MLMVAGSDMVFLRTFLFEPLSLHFRSMGCVQLGQLCDSQCSVGSARSGLGNFVLGWFGSQRNQIPYGTDRSEG